MPLQMPESNMSESRVSKGISRSLLTEVPHIMPYIMPRISTAVDRLLAVLGPQNNPFCSTQDVATNQKIPCCPELDRRIACVI